MRPHFLQWAGIGPYPRRVEVNFDELSTLGLYLIVGPTGAGKTTIFDAITYALFGKLAGARTSQHIISDHSGADSSEVELQFSHRGNRYTVRRKPSPAGKNSKPNDHLLIAHGSSDGLHREEIRVTGASRVTSEVESILGLDATQFNRVMLLPQNEFQQFLLANSTDKEKLLRSLFDTELFHRAEEDLEEVARDLAKAAEVAAQKIAFAHTQIADLWSSLIAADLLPQPDPSDDPAEISLGVLQSLIATRHGEAAVVSRSLSEAAQKSTEDRSIAETEDRRYTAHVQLTELRRLATEQEPTLRHSAELLGAHDQASRIAEEIHQRDVLAKDVAEASAHLNAARTAAKVIIDASPWTTQLLTDLRTSISHSTPATIATAFASLKNLIETASQQHVTADEATQSAQKLRQRQAELLDQIAATTVSMDQAVAELLAAQEASETAQTLALELPSLQIAVQELNRLEAAGDLSAPLTALGLAEAHHATKLTAANSAQTALDRGLAAKSQFLAGDMARTLAIGDPCPVCGSLEHPSPAPLSPDAPDLEELTSARDRAHDELTGAELSLSRCQEALEVAQQVAASLAPNEDRTTTRALHEIASTAARELPTLTLKVKELTDQRQSLQSRLDKETAEFDTARTGAEQAERTAITHRSQAQIPQSFLTNATQLLNDLTVHVSDIGVLTAQLDAAHPVHQAATQRVSQLLAASSFCDEDSVAAAVLPDDRQLELTKMIEQGQIRATLMTRLEGTIGDQPPPTHAPDLTTLLAEEDEAQRLAALATQATTTLHVAATQCNDIALKLEQIGPEATMLQDRADRFREIAKVFRHGKRPHYPLERWVQRAIFEDVCQVASERIKVLSSGRYLLTLEAEEGRERALAGGLDLYVTDGHTGRSRAVQTLSGGEQFLTSLALALALADVVQQMSGGIELSSLFIDEGFGSLDGETLDTAVEVLRSLQDSGRSVGVISHVEAMQHDLPVGIRVTPGPTGSRITFPALHHD